MNTKQKGDLTELQCILAFYEQGYGVSIPYGENSRYDFIADINGKLLKIQVKTCHLTNDNSGIEFATCSSKLNCSESTRVSYSKEEIDYFATYYNNQCYLIPVEECGSAYKKLRLVPTKNGQKVGVCFAEDYTLEKQL